MPKKLTKDIILEGASRREVLYINEYDAEVIIRPLTDGELSRIFSSIGNIPLREDGTPDVSKIDISKNLEILKLAAATGLVEPKLTVEELETMRFGVPEYIGMKVLEISGVVRSEEEAKKKE
ncbi:MAG: hypothetical protein QXP91_07845 [Candidatus Methanomethylicia archaeon]